MLHITLHHITHVTHITLHHITHSTHHTHHITSHHSDHSLGSISLYLFLFSAPGGISDIDTRLEGIDWQWGGSEGGNEGGSEDVIRGSEGQVEDSLTR